MQRILGGMLLLGLVAGRARAGTPIPLGAPVTAIAAGPSRLLAATSRDLLLLDLQGQVMRRLPLDEPETSPGRPAVADDPFAIGAGVGSADDFDEAYDADLDLEDAENVSGRWTRGGKRLGRRTAARGSADGGVVVEVDQRFGWWGRGDGLWRMDLDGQGALQVLRATGTGVQALATSLEGKYVIVLNDGIVLRSVDGGATFARLFPVAGDRAEVAVTSAGTAFVLDASGLRRLRVDATMPEPVALASAETIASCGNLALAITASRLVVLDDERAEPALARAGALPADTTRVTCSKDGALWAALGSTLWIGRGDGQSSAVGVRAPAMTPSTIAATQDGVWLVSSLGLWFEPALPFSVPAPASARTLRVAPDERRLAIRAPPWWLFVLPRVDIGFVSARSSRRHDVRAFALLTFTFERGLARALERDGLLARLAVARRDSLLPSVGAFATPDPRNAEPDTTIRIQETSP